MAHCSPLLVGPLLPLGFTVRSTAQLVPPLTEEPQVNVFVLQQEIFCSNTVGAPVPHEGHSIGVDAVLRAGRYCTVGLLLPPHTCGGELIKEHPEPFCWQSETRVSVSPSTALLASAPVVGSRKVPFPRFGSMFGTMNGLTHLAAAGMKPEGFADENEGLKASALAVALTEVSADTDGNTLAKKVGKPVRCTVTEICGLPSGLGLVGGTTTLAVPATPAILFACTTWLAWAVASVPAAVCTAVKFVSVERKEVNPLNTKACAPASAAASAVLCASARAVYRVARSMPRAAIASMATIHNATITIV